MKKILYFIPSFIILFFIFGFSAQDGQESGSLSLMVYNIINSIIALPESPTIFIIRKCAHMSEFGVLSLTLYYGFYKNHFSNLFSLALGTTFLIACTDEFHQLFVPGRAGLFTDVLIDTTGAFLFLIALYIIKRLTIHVE